MGQTVGGKASEVWRVFATDSSVNLEDFDSNLMGAVGFILTISGLDLGILSTVEFTASDMKDFFVFIAPFVSKTGVVISSGYKFMLILSDE